MFDKLDDATKQQILPLRSVNRKASEVLGGAIMNKEGTRRLDDFEAKYALSLFKQFLAATPLITFLTYLRHTVHVQASSQSCLWSHISDGNHGHAMQHTDTVTKVVPAACTP